MLTGLPLQDEQCMLSALGASQHHLLNKWALFEHGTPGQGTLLGWGGHGSTRHVIEDYIHRRLEVRSIPNWMSTS